MIGRTRRARAFIGCCVGLSAIAVLDTADPVLAGCRVESYSWTGFATVHAFQPLFGTGVSIPAREAGESLIVQAVTFEVFDGNSEGATPTRADDDEPNEQVGVRIGLIDVNDISPDLPDTVAEGAPQVNYSGLINGQLYGWTGIPILGGELQFRHASFYGLIGPQSNSLLVHKLAVLVQRCGDNVVPTTTTTTTPTTTSASTTTSGPTTTAGETSTTSAGSTTTSDNVTTTTEDGETTTTVDQSGTTTTVVETTTTTIPVDTGVTLREVGAQHGVIVGAAIDGYELVANQAYADAIARHFNSVTPENAMKLGVFHPTATTWDFSESDVIVAFAQQHGLQVRGHSPVWGQLGGDGVPQWLQDITDPQEFRAQFISSIETIMQRYQGAVNRWDVVNEPYEYGSGALDNNLFVQRLGTDYIDLAFRTAHVADPSAELWLNETNTEYVPAKTDSLVALVTRLKADGVPIDGVGLQTHLINGDPGAGQVRNLASRLRALGVKVAITELDIPTGVPRSLPDATALYGRVAEELIDAGGSEITVWGVSDNRTWLDYNIIRNSNPALWAWDLPSKPLLLDTNFVRKAAYQALIDAIEHPIINPDPTTTTTTTTTTTIPPTTTTISLTKPGPPMLLALQPSAKGTLTATWSPPTFTGTSALNGYVVTATPTAGGAAVAKVAAATATTFAFSGLLDNTDYTVTVSARNGSGKGPNSNQRTATTWAVPGAPNITSVTATALGTLSATWDPPTSDGGSPITGYVLVATPSVGAAITRFLPASATTYALGGLGNSATYSFTITARTAVAAGPTSAAHTGTTWGPPGAPTITGVNPTGRGALTAQWAPPASDGGRPITAYVITAAPTTGPPIVRNVVGTATSTTFSGLGDGTTLTVTIVAKNVLGTSPSAAPVAGTTTGLPGAPSLSAVTPSARGALTLTWTPPASDGGSPITAYVVTVTPPVGPALTKVVPAPATGFVFTQLADNTPYTVTVAARNATATGIGSNTRTGTTWGVPSAPVFDSLTSPAAHRLTASWSPPTTSGGTPVTGYVITATPAGGGAPVVKAVGDVTTVTLFALTSGTTYTVQVVAKNAVGSSPASAPRQAQPL